ncbi:hypothetical protein [Micromonospora sp. CPCC 206061]|uniref:hypothetical protein n=1 Tax=Micromonospora sp. CPCC 206061 TaxID=3122410 RepID=UPI002FF3C98C
MAAYVSSGQIARYAGTRRATVSNWRRRHPDFPAPVSGTTEQPLFDAEAVATWLDGRPQRSGELDSHPAARTYGDVFRHNLNGSAHGNELEPGAFLQRGLELLLAYESETAEALTIETAEQHVAKTIQQLRSDLGPARAAEQLYVLATNKGWSGARSETPRGICELIANLVPEMYAGWDTLSVTELAATTGRLLATTADAGARALSFSRADPSQPSLLRLRLLCHGAEAREAEAVSDVVLADPPFQPGEHADSPDQPLQWALASADWLAPGGFALIVVPQWVLSRRGNLPVVKARDALLRQGRLHAIIQLPRSVYPNVVGADHALLVLRDPGSSRPLAVTICDADQIHREHGEGWIGETVRLLAGPKSGRGKPPCVDVARSHLNSASSLVPAHILVPSTNADERLTQARQARAAATRVIEAEQGEVLKVLDRITFRPSSTEPRHTTVGELLQAGQLIHLRGHRITPTAISRNGQRIVGREELLGQQPIGIRRVDLANLASHNAATLTEPGDVLLLADPSLPVIVDDDGGSVLMFPAQGLRVPGHRKHASTFRDEPQKPWIGPHALAALLRASRNATRTGRSHVRRSGLLQMQLPYISDTARDRLDDVLYQLHEATQLARDRVAVLETLQARIGDGIADGAFTLGPDELATPNNRRGR